MNKPVLLVLAAGMGSRYGGIKQIDPIGPCNELIIDYSIYDAKRAGFETVVFVIKHEIEEDFKKAIGDRVSKFVNVKYAYQNLNSLPDAIEVPQGRVKPWGTAHAMLAAKDLIDGPFAVINADDYYGVDAFKVMYDYLTCEHGDYDYCMVGYELKNTVTENGTVSRGVCEVDECNNLKEINERTKIACFDDEIKYSEDEGDTWTSLPIDSKVSMNLWGFNKNILDETEADFKGFLETAIKENPLKCEYFIPLIVSKMINSGKAKVNVLYSADKWHGVTYKEDKPEVVKALADLTDKGVYPYNLWG